MAEEKKVQFPPFRIHSRTGTVQFTLKPAHFTGDAYETRDGGKVRVLKKGHVMVEMANAAEAAGPPDRLSYDWANKVAMKLSDIDIQQILDGFEGKDCRIVHDPNKAHGTEGDGSLPRSCLQLRKGERFGWFLSMSRGDKKARCPIGEADAATFRQLLSRAVVRMYGW